MRRPLASLVVLVTLAGPLRAADGAPDPGFSADGRATQAWALGDASYAEATTAATFDGGAVVVGGTGYYTLPGVLGTADMLLARWTGSGVLDVGWGDGGRRRIGFDLVENGFDVLLDLVPHADGAVTLLGWTQAPDGQRPALVRLLPDGKPDPAFGDGGFLWIDDLPWPNATLQFEAATHQQDGKLLIAGSCHHCAANTNWNLFVMRLLPNGAPDPSWSFDGWATIGTAAGEDEVLTSISSDPAGGVVIGLRQSSLPTVVRLGSNGGVDSGFADAGWFHPPFLDGSFTLTGLAVTPGTRDVVVVGWGTPGSTDLGVVFRLSGDGTLDDGYGTPGPYAFLDLEEGVRLFAIARQGNGRVLVGGRINANGTQKGGFFLARLDGAGEPDDTFDGNGVARYEFDRVDDAVDQGVGLILAQGRPLLVGFAKNAAEDEAFAVLRTENAYLFADGFESAGSAAWARD
jgi:uncharacterized delta-60 repeat protein